MSADHEANGAAPPPANPFDFDALAAAPGAPPAEVRGIRWQGKEYALRAGPEEVNVKYTNAKFRNARLDDGKLTAVNGGGELPSLLVSLCLFRVARRDDGTEAFQPVSQQALQSQWPAPFVNKLFEEAKRLCGIDQDARTRAQKLRDLRKELAKLEAEEAKEKAEAEAAGEGAEGNRYSPATAATSA